MKKAQYKSKRFLFPILSLVLISIISIASISSYITISMFKTHVKEHIKETQIEYTANHKKRVYRDVKLVNDAIKFQITIMEDKLKASLKEKIQVAHSLATFIYNAHKNTLPKEEIKEKISKALAVIKFNNNRGYYFVYDNKTKIILGHEIKKFIGKDMTYFKDARGQNLAQLNAAALKENKIGYNKIYFNKPDNQNKEFPKIICLTRFEPLDLVLGIGEYLDVLEKQIKELMLLRFQQPMFHAKDKYFTILDVHNKNGGDEFATVLLNTNRPELAGKKVSDKDEDIKGQRFKRNFLNLVVTKGEGYLEYWYQKPSTKLPAAKMSFFYLQKDWNWIIASGFYYDDLEKQITTMQKLIISHTNETINKTLMWVFIFSLIAILIATFMSLRIDNTIKHYTDKIIDYEDNKRKQDQKLMQQSKLVSMGEMIGNISHQWRQPLGIIAMDANNIIIDVDLDMVEMKALRKHAKNILSQTSHLSQTIDDFKNFIKGDREKKIFHVKNVIHSFIHLVQSSIDHSHINLVLDLKDNIQVLGYENELIQCLINIFNNSNDILVQNNIENKLIFISTTVEKDNAIIKINDNAGGIPEEILPKIFDPYFTTKHKSQGTGLGLHMTYNLIVDGMKGFIEASNIEYTYKKKSYNGAEFKITLPMS